MRYNSSKEKAKRSKKRGITIFVILVIIVLLGKLFGLVD